MQTAKRHDKFQVLIQRFFDITFYIFTKRRKLRRQTATAFKLITDPFFNPCYVLLFCLLLFRLRKHPPILRQACFGLRDFVRVYVHLFGPDLILFDPRRLITYILYYHVSIAYTSPARPSYTQPRLKHNPNTCQ